MTDAPKTSCGVEEAGDKEAPCLTVNDVRAIARREIEVALSNFSRNLPLRR